MSLARVRGVRDLIGKDARKFEKVVKAFNDYTVKAGYETIVLPSMEDSSLYIKGLGNLSDIVTKEMFFIQDKGYVLRPEGTAGAIRAYLMNCSLGEKKLWKYYGSMFRHEKPQSGRFREFFQFGIENISSTVSPTSDAEVISIAYNILKGLQVENVLLLNTLGDELSRQSYIKELENFFEGKKLSKISLNRMEGKNFLRILDSKEPEDQEIINLAPVIQPHLTKEAQAYYATLKAGLDVLEVPYVESPRLVRGLDYYSNACFEFISNSKAIIGGGRYDNLAGMLDKSKNKKVGGIGWAAGIDRISELVQFKEEQRYIQVVPVGGHNIHLCLKVAKILRESTDFIVKLRTDAETLKQHMGSIKGYEPEFIVFLGDDEIKENKAVVKICSTSEQKLVELGELNTFFK